MDDHGRDLVLEAPELNGVPKHDLATGHDLPEPIIGFAKPLFHPNDVGDVSGGGVDETVLRRRHGDPRQPSIRSVLAAISIPEAKPGLAGADLDGLVGGLLAVVGMNPLEMRHRAKLVDRKTEQLLP